MSVISKLQKPCPIRGGLGGLACDGHSNHFHIRMDEREHKNRHSHILAIEKH
jgi:hypothetical protein